LILYRLQDPHQTWQLAAVKIPRLIRLDSFYPLPEFYLWSLGTPITEKYRGSYGPVLK
jgi:hypothetical protein